jgi:hypothetical protein
MNERNKMRGKKNISESCDGRRPRSDAARIFRNGRTSRIRFDLAAGRGLGQPGGVRGTSGDVSLLPCPDTETSSQRECFSAICTLWPGLPDWANFRLLGGCFKNYRNSPNFKPFFHCKSYSLILTKMGWATYILGDIFTNSLVTLIMAFFHQFLTFLK